MAHFFQPQVPAAAAAPVVLLQPPSRALAVSVAGSASSSPRRPRATQVARGSSTGGASAAGASGSSSGASGSSSGASGSSSGASAVTSGALLPLSPQRGRKRRPRGTVVAVTASEQKSRRPKPGRKYRRWAGVIWRTTRPPDLSNARFQATVTTFRCTPELCPSTGRPHLQFAVVMIAPQRRTAVVKIIAEMAGVTLPGLSLSPPASLPASLPLCYLYVCADSACGAVFVSSQT